jgi:ligand-binding SRPBCC domain-containing protein
MMIHKLCREQWVARPAEEVFAFFSEAANLQKLTPPWMQFEILTPPPIRMAAGTKIAYRIGWRFIRLRWLSEIVEWEPPQQFVDVQLRGPYAFWHHTHSFVEERDETRITDIVRYRLPWGIIGSAAHRFMVARDLKAVFDYRAVRIATLLEGKEREVGNGNVVRRAFH